jgi:hypothetical protein
MMEENFEISPEILFLARFTQLCPLTLLLGGEGQGTPFHQHCHLRRAETDTCLKVTAQGHRLCFHLLNGGLSRFLKFCLVRGKFCMTFIVNL